MSDTRTARRRAVHAVTIVRRDGTRHEVRRAADSPVAAALAVLRDPAIDADEIEGLVLAGVYAARCSAWAELACAAAAPASHAADAAIHASQ